MGQKIIESVAERDTVDMNKERLHATIMCTIMFYYVYNLHYM